MLIGFWKALKAGERLKNAETWKNRQTLANVLLAVLLFGNKFLPKVGINLPEEIVTNISNALAELMVIANVYFINATSRKVGIKKGESK